MGCDDSSDHRSHSPDLLQLASPSSSSSSSSSPESSFREIEDAFLQTQTRIWLGEVLQIRLDEQLIISEVLADGELLFQVSKLVWRLLLSKHTELRHIIAYQNHPFAPKKNGGRYRPYSNVDSFLKICKILGLTGIDLFSPSDVVEKRNTRRVCMCIRSFSIKARSKNINFPDFDIVTYTITMAKDMVGCIRRNLELYQSNLADSPSYYLQKHAGGKFRQASTRDHEKYLKVSDDAEISHPELQSDGLCTDILYDYTSEINSNVEDIQVPSMVKSLFMSKDFDQLDIQSQRRIETSENEFELSCSMESLHASSGNMEHDCKFTWSSSPSCGNPHFDSSAVTSHLDTRVKHAQESGIMDFHYSEQNLLGNNASVIGNPENDKTPARIDALERVATSNLIGHVKDSRDLDENSTSNVYQSASSHGSSSTPGIIGNGRRYFEIGDNMEVLRNWSMEALNLGDKFDAQDYFQNLESFELQDNNMDLWKEIIEGCEFPDKMKYREMAYDITSNARYSHSVEKYEENENSLYSNAGFHQSEDLLSFQSYLLSEFCKWDQKGKCAVISANDHKSLSSSFPKVGSHEETTRVRHKTSEVISSVPNDEEEAVVDIDIDSKQLNKDCQAVLSNVVGEDYHEKCLSARDDANDHFRDRDVNASTQGVGDREERTADTVIDVVPSTYHNVVVSCNDDAEVSHTRSCLTNKCSKLECKDGDQACQYDMDPACHSEYTTEGHVPEEIKPEDEVSLSADNSVEKKETSIERPSRKPQNMLLVKSVLGGTAAFGILFTFLHLRRNGREKASASSKASSGTAKDKVQKLSSRDTQKSRREGVYPAEKLKLGD